MSKWSLSLPAGRRGVVWRFPRRDGITLLTNAPHSHDELEVILTTSGRCTYLVRGERRTLHPRTLLWLLPGQEHMFGEGTADFTMWLVGISRGLLEEMKPRIPILAKRNPDAVLMRTLPRKCVRLLNAVAQELATGFQPLDCHDVGLSWWLASAWNAYEYGDARDAGALHLAVSRAMAILERDSSTNLAALAEAIRISPSQLSRLFKRQAGTSITDFRNRLRLEAFLERRDGTKEKAMFLTARDAGFGSYAQFNRVFRREMGCSPEEYYDQGRQGRRANPAPRTKTRVPSARSSRRSRASGGLPSS
jgi:AraC-like DNA-binding protein